MENNILDKINDEMSLEELGDVVKTALSVIYSKLRNEQGFGFEQHCSVVSYGDNPYDVSLVIIDGFSYDGENYVGTFWI